MPLLTEALFLHDVSTHAMTILRNEGLHRHLHFKRPDTVTMSFDLITWPGHLCFTGDMGTFVFRRIPDMFAFFRTDRTHNPRVQEKQYVLGINEDYWAQKCVAADRAGIKAYSSTKFIRSIEEWLEDQHASVSVREAVEDEVLTCADEGQNAAQTAAANFTHPSGFEFADFWEVDLTEYTETFLWCCYAIAWGLQQYDIAYPNTEELACD